MYLEYLYTVYLKQDKLAWEVKFHEIKLTLRECLLSIWYIKVYLDFYIFIFFYIFLYLVYTLYIPYSFIP